MSKTRFNALSAFSSRPKLNVELPAEKISDFFASSVFGDQQMKEFLPSDAYKRLAACIRDGKKVDREIADQVASAMKSWAMKQGATHYTHWFQPLTGTTAEKHDSFFMPKGTAGVEEFGADALAQQERAQVQVNAAQMQRAQAELDLLDFQISQAKMLSPFNALIVVGDLSQRVGGIVKQGEVLFEISPRETYRLAIYVNEFRIADVEKGRTGKLVLAALPDYEIPFEVTRITPLAEVQDGATVYRVEAELTESNDDQGSASSSREDNPDFKNGRWQPFEHLRFIKGCLLYGNNWKKVT